MPGGRESDFHKGMAVARSIMSSGNPEGSEEEP